MRLKSDLNSSIFHGLQKRSSRRLTALFSLISLIAMVFMSIPTSTALGSTLTTQGSSKGTMLSGGVHHSLYLNGGALYAWGGNDFGQLGDGSNISRFLPVSNRQLSGLLIQVDAGAFHSLGLDKDGHVWAWGLNDQGQLGDGSTTNRNVPFQIPNFDGVIAIDAGIDGSVALKQDGTVWQWGKDAGLTPTQVSNVSGVVQIAAGDHYVALKEDGTVWAWGINDRGQLGDGTFNSSSTPVQVQGLNSVSVISASFDYTLALTREGTVYSWGGNSQGKLGIGNTTNQATPQLVQGFDRKIKEVSAGYFHSLAMTEDGKLMTWGSNSYALLGDGVTDRYSTKAIPVSYTEGLSIPYFSAGGFHNLVVSNEFNSSYYVYNVYAWGYNEAGQLGDGTLFHEAALTQVVLEPTQNVGHRIAGKDRIQTAIGVSREAWYYGARTVILSRADDFPDALTGAPLAEAYAAPILLTNNQTLSPETAEEIERLHPNQIFLLGSTGAISESIQVQLEKSYKVTRLGGQDRYETAAEVARYLKENNLLKSTKAVIAYGQNFPDALSVSSLAAHQGIPILLSETHQLPEVTQKALIDLGVKETIIVGGTGVVDSKVEESLPSPVRYAGSDRYTTAMEIAQNMNADSHLIFIATGKDFPDALAASAFASWTNSPIVLVDDKLPEGFWSNPNVAPKRQIILLGGEGAVPKTVFDELNRAMPLKFYDYSLVE